MDILRRTMAENNYNETNRIWQMHCGFWTLAFQPCSACNTGACLPGSVASTDNRNEPPFDSAALTLVLSSHSNGSLSSVSLSATHLQFLQMKLLLCFQFMLSVLDFMFCLEKLYQWPWQLALFLPRTHREQDSVLLVLKLAQPDCGQTPKT